MDAPTGGRAGSLNFGTAFTFAIDRFLVVGFGLLAGSDWSALDAPTPSATGLPSLGSPLAESPRFAAEVALSAFEDCGASEGCCEESPASADAAPVAPAIAAPIPSATARPLARPIFAATDTIFVLSIPPIPWLKALRHSARSLFMFITRSQPADHENITAHGVEKYR